MKSARVLQNNISVPREDSHVDTVLESILDGPDLLVPELLTDGRSPVVQVGHPIDGLDGETESIGLVLDGELKRGVDVSLFPVTTDVDVAGPVSPVGESVDKPGVRVEVDNDGLVSGEDAVKLLVRQACRAISKRLVKGIIERASFERHTVGMILVRDQPEQVNDVDESDLDPGQVLLEQGGGSQSLSGDDITNTAHDNVGFLSR